MSLVDFFKLVPEAFIDFLSYDLSSDNFFLFFVIIITAFYHTVVVPFWGFLHIDN